MKLSCSAKKKQPLPDPSPEAGLEAGLAGGLAGGLEAGVEAGLEAQGGKPSKPSKHLPQQAPQGQGHFSIRPPGPRPQQWLSIGFQSCRLPARKHSKRSKTLQTPKTLQTLQNPPNPPGLEACFEQVAQGLWLVRRVHRRSKTISLPGRLELPTLRLTASCSNQLSYGCLCRRPKLVPVLEKRLNNSWLQVVCQTKGQQPK